LNLCTGIRKMSLVIQEGCLGGRNRFGAMTKSHKSAEYLKSIPKSTMMMAATNDNLRWMDSKTRAASHTPRRVLAVYAVNDGTNADLGRLKSTVQRLVMGIIERNYSKYSFIIVLIDYFDCFENSLVILSVSKSTEIIEWLKLLDEWFFRNEIDQCLKHKISQNET